MTVAPIRAESRDGAFDAFRTKSMPLEENYHRRPVTSHIF